MRARWHWVTRMTLVKPLIVAALSVDARNGSSQHVPAVHRRLAAGDSAAKAVAGTMSFRHSRDDFATLMR